MNLYFMKRLKLLYFSDINKLHPHRSTNCLTSVVWSDRKVNSLSRQQHVQQRWHNFWQRWSTDFLLDLQHGPRRKGSKPNIKLREFFKKYFETVCQWASRYHNQVSPWRRLHNSSAKSQKSAGITDLSYT